VRFAHEDYASTYPNPEYSEPCKHQEVQMIHTHPPLNTKTVNTGGLIQSYPWFRVNPLTLNPTEPSYI
jgi:hypothetical protein